MDLASGDAFLVPFKGQGGGTFKFTFKGPEMSWCP